MTKDSSASTRQQTPHVNQTTRIANINPLKQRAELIVEDDSREKIEALAEMICAGGNESAVALLVLMCKLQNSADPKSLAHSVKHFAFTRCGEMNVNGMVDAQIEIVESELFAGNTRLC